ncbi:hypothetical protein GCM10010116_60160 [Microbispora rosea subsp. aerata]|nr:hypothetical protein GCM10010116_60160 [Microbispora rosea subsp. aerata]GIH59017.1 hypothetical protein Mro02_59310 [Microbispora rosea subsp. aerata]GLJ87358.1 hypothetical protein GCM10017588_61030 [Microbispora rosea subsp. aerata]
MRRVAGLTGHPVGRIAHAAPTPGRSLDILMAATFRLDSARGLRSGIMDPGRVFSRLAGVRSL